MKDMLDNDLQLKDKVAFILTRGRATHLWHGIVKGFSDKMVRVEYKDRSSGKVVVSSRAPYNCVIIRN